MSPGPDYATPGEANDPSTERRILPPADSDKNLVELPVDHPLCLELLRQCRQGNSAARKRLLEMPYDCALRIRWNEERQPLVAQWIEKHDHLVRARYRDRLRGFPEEVDDGVQDFWMSFLIDAMELKYDPAIAVQEAYVRMLANRKAINYLKKIWTARRKTSPIKDDESNLPVTSAKRQAIEPDPAEPARPWITDHLSRLVALNEIKVYEALVLACKAWLRLGPAVLVERHLETTLFQLCDLVASRPVPNEDEMAPVLRLLTWLRQQLALPPESPWGNRPSHGTAPSSGTVAAESSSRFESGPWPSEPVAS